VSAISLDSIVLKRRDSISTEDEGWGNDIFLNIFIAIHYH